MVCLWADWLCDLGQASHPFCVLVLICSVGTPSSRSYTRGCLAWDRCLACEPPRPCDCPLTGYVSTEAVWLAGSPWELPSKLVVPFHPRRWFCHVDDDNYVNPVALLKLLKTFPQTLDVYVGRPSLNRPIHASEPRPHNRTVCPSPDSLAHCPVDQGPCRAWGRGQPGAGPEPGAGLGPCGAWGRGQPGAGPEPGAGPGWGWSVEDFGGFSGFRIWPRNCVFGLVALPLTLSLLYAMGRLK